MTLSNKFLVLYVFVAVLGFSTVSRNPPPLEASQLQSFSFSWSADTRRREDPIAFDNIINLLNGPNPMLALYREDVTHQQVVNFFVQLTGSPETALPVLYHADRANVSLSLVFSLIWVESRFSPMAVNQNATSIDRGLFQLNNRTFRDLELEDFFHIDTNTFHGIDFLVWCLAHTTDEYQALAVYNAGLTRVRAGMTPASTLVYVERVRMYRERLLQRFRQYILDEFPSHSPG